MAFVRSSISLGLLLAGFGCSRSPKQYSGAQPPIAQPQLTLSTQSLPSSATNPEGGETQGRVAQEDPNYVDNLIRENSLKPIVFGQGAGGVSFSNTYQEARDILAPEWFTTADGLTVYREFLGVYWRQDEPRKPDMMVLFNGYAGPMIMPPGYKEVHIGTELSEYFTAEDPQGKKIVNDMWRMMSKSTEEGDCLDGNLAKQPNCIVQVNNEAGQIIIVFQGYGAMVVSNDQRKALGVVLLQQSLPSFPLGQFFDLVKGEFTGIRKNTEGKIEKPTLRLGQSLEDFKNLVQARADTSVTPINFFKAYNSILFWFTKSQFTKEYLEPNSSEIISDVAVVGGASTKIQINGKMPYVNSKGEIKPTAGISSSSNPLGTQIQISPDGASSENLFASNRQIKTNFVTSLAKYLEDNFKKAIQDKAENPADIMIIPGQVSGLHGDSLYPEYAAQSGFINTKTGEGQVVTVTTTLGLPSVNYFISRLQSPLEAQIQVSHLQPLVIGGDELAGFKIGSFLEVKDIDLVRREITVMVGDTAVRSELALNSINRVAVVEADKYRETNLVEDGVTIYGVRLGLKRLSSEEAQKFGLPAAEGMTFAQITSISSSGYSTEITSLCELPEFASVPEQAGETLGEAEPVEPTLAPKITFNMLDNDFFSYLKQTDTKECKFITPLNRNGVEKKEVVIFPEKRVKVIFDQRALSSITIY